MKRNSQLVTLTHLSQLLDLVTGVGGFIVPLIIWAVKKDEIEDLDEHGRAIINFRISMFIYTLICIPLILLFGLGLLGIFAVMAITYIYAVVNAIKANKNEKPSYPLSMTFV
ncbi:conserved hypothetical protein [Tenacibaculum litopenaei]|jgi:uncharacterized Tic20 family protein|uniref:DUF4870 domain-containing protein n=1 Tax=Tenacibaculum litopenaei TaxID=396016 RepID=UPI003892F4B1